MTTLGTMEDRIADELLRDDLSSNIRDAIKSAIEHYADERFWFNEGNNDPGVNTITSSTTYTLSAEWLEFDSFTVEVASNEYPLIPRTVEWYREVNTNPSTVVGIPTDYAFHANTYWLYPTPNGAYPVRIYGLKRITELDSAGLPTLTDTSVTNAWFTFGEDLIRNRAKAFVQANKIHDAAGAAISAALEDDAYAKLKRKSRRKTSTGIIQPTDW